MNKYGFNFQWFLHYNPLGPAKLDTRALDFMKEYGLDFVRIPLDYRFWIKDFVYERPDERMLKTIDGYLNACWDRGLHVNLNIHRAPGYCIMNNDWERDNLWTDQVALDAYVLQWEMFARRYQNISPDLLSFDLMNEPPNINQYGCTRENHARVIRAAFAAIRRISPLRRIYIDGLDGGNTALPELSDLDVTMSCRGYQPMALTHYHARWWEGATDTAVPEYPGMLYNGIRWDKQALVEFYKPWRELQKQQVPLHVGEFGCYGATPNQVALSWFSDLLSLYRDWGWGYSLWEFDGTFGVAYHGRPDTEYTLYKGLPLDMQLVDLLLKNRS